ncbi:MAG: lipid-A-disaccharide synthase [Gammaproteobacteria bacterium]
MLNVGIVAGEASGDRLGAGLVRALRMRVAGLRVSGIAGPQMRAAGVESIVDAERLSVMGFAEVAARLPELLSIRARVRRHFLAERPDVFVGVDAPDFNLGLEAGLRRGGIRTVHYVSPTVWAWREGRLRTIRAAADLVLAIFPFEEDYYRARGMAARFVGHPLADAVPEYPDRGAARAALGLEAARPVLAVLPGSRASELAQHLDAFLETAAICARQVPGLQIAVPAVDERALARIRAAMAGRSGLPARSFLQRAQDVLAAADAVLTASGTATIETMLSGRPMVVAYRMAPLSFAIIRRLVRVQHCSMVNLLAGQPLVPEFVQDAMRPDAMARALVAWLRDPASAAPMLERFAALRATLRHPPGADANAAEAVLAVAAGRMPPACP